MATSIKASNQMTLVDVTDAYSVILTSEAYTFVGGTSGVGSGSSCSTQAVAYCGSNQCSKVTVDSSAITCPTGISATVTNSGTSEVTITFTTTATISAACEATIPVTVDGITINKKFSFAVALQGATGAKGDTGATGATGSQWYTGTAITGTSTTGTVFSSSGITSAKVNDMYLNTSTGYVYKCTTAGAASAAKWTYVANIKGATGAKGDTGEAGEDAITLSITTSNGTVFKNSSGSTVLTAHVYQSGTECTISDAGAVTNSAGTSLGSINWYKGTDTTVVATAKTLTVSASDVTNAVAYTCQLEG